MVERDRTTCTDRRIEVHDGRVEKLPFQKSEFDLIVSTTSFDHWRDQAGGLRECARVVDRTGVLVIADVCRPCSCQPSSEHAGTRLALAPSGS